MLTTTGTCARHPESHADPLHIDASDAEFPCRFFLGRAAKAVVGVSYPNVYESDCHERVDELCLQQSATDSTGPELDIAPDLWRELHAGHDVGDLHASAWPQHPRDFCKRQIFLRDEIQDAIRDHDIDRGIVER